jgi:ligand-binding sensor domain-containing protein
MSRWRFSRRKAALGAAILTASGIVFAGWTLWRASRALSDAGQQLRGASVIQFTSKAITPVIPAGFARVAAPAVFIDAAVFQGRLYIVGPAGLDAYDPDGTALAHFRTGIELPPAPLVAIATGFAGDSRTPELWIATGGEGLVAFDGRNFRQVRAQEPRFRKLTAILVTENGRVLMGTEKAGVLVYDGREIKPLHSSLADLHVTALAGDDAELWTGTMDRGVLHFKAGAFEAIDAELPDRQVLSLARDGETTFVGTGMGVAEIRGGKFTRVIAPGYFAQTIAAGGGKLWIGTLEEGMFEAPLEAHPGRDARLHASPVCAGCSIRRILRVENDVLAVAEDSLWRVPQAPGAGQAGQAAASQALVSRGDSALLADRNIAALSVDREGGLWIGYFDRGLEILPAGGGRTRRFEDDHLFCINRIVQDNARGVAAVATANGLVLFDASMD